MGDEGICVRGAGRVESEVFETGAPRGGVEGANLGFEGGNTGWVVEGAFTVAVRGDGGSVGYVCGGGVNLGEDGIVA